MAFTSYLEAAQNLRKYISDYPQLNELDNEFETTDDELIEYIKDVLLDINLTFEPRTTFALSAIVTEPGEDGYLPWSTVRAGAILQYLTAKGILNARNLLTYSDSGGVQITNTDRWGRYINYYNVLVNKYVAGVKQVKLRINLSGAFGGSASPLSFDIY